MTPEETMLRARIAAEIRAAQQARSEELYPYYPDDWRVEDETWDQAAAVALNGPVPSESVSAIAEAAPYTVEYRVPMPGHYHHEAFLRVLRVGTEWAIFNPFRPVSGEPVWNGRRWVSDRKEGRYWPTDREALAEAICLAPIEGEWAQRWYDEEFGKRQQKGTEG